MTIPKEIRASYSKGVIEPLEKLELDDGDEIIISIVGVPHADRTLRALEASAGLWAGSHDPEELKRNIYANRLTGSRSEPRL